MHAERLGCRSGICSLLQARSVGRRLAHVVPGARHRVRRRLGRVLTLGRRLGRLDLVGGRIFHSRQRVRCLLGGGVRRRLGRRRRLRGGLVRGGLLRRNLRRLLGGRLRLRCFRLGRGRVDRRLGRFGCRVCLGLLAGHQACGPLGKQCRALLRLGLGLALLLLRRGCRLLPLLHRSVGSLKLGIKLCLISDLNEPRLRQAQHVRSRLARYDAHEARVDLPMTKPRGQPRPIAHHEPRADRRRR